MSWSIDPEQAEAMRLNPETPRTDACPKCDSRVVARGGISFHHVCANCGNVWQPFNFSRQPTSIFVSRNTRL